MDESPPRNCPANDYLLRRSLASSRNSPSSSTRSDHPEIRSHNLLCRTVVAVVVAEDVGRLPRRCGGCCCCCCDGGFEGCVWNNHWSIVVVTGPFVVFLELGVVVVVLLLDRNIKSTTVS